MSEMPGQDVSAERIDAAQARFAEEVRVARLAGDHVWIAVQTHRVSSQTLLESEGGRLLLDAESMRMLQVGCYVCERPFDARLAGRRCPGEPNGGGAWGGLQRRQ